MASYMVARKAGKNMGAKQQMEKALPESAAQAIKSQLRSVLIPIEERVAIEDHVNNVSREMEYLIDGIDRVPKEEDQRKILGAYKRFLKENLQAINGRLGKTGAT